MAGWPAVGWHTNQLWQSDTMFGPYCDTGPSAGPRQQARLSAFIDDANDDAVSPTVIVYHKGQRIGSARPLVPVANGLLRRKEQP